MMDLKGDGAGQVLGIARGTGGLGEQEAKYGIADCPAEISQPRDTRRGWMCDGGS
jgi:hypothetical protein